MISWVSDMTSAPRDGTEILLYYADYLGVSDFVVSGHWYAVPGRQFEDTWEHSMGYGDADMWAEMPPGPIKKEAPARS